MNVNQWGAVNQWGGATPLIINASIGGTLTSGYRANVTIGTVTIRIYSETHYEIPDY